MIKRMQDRVTIDYSSITCNGEDIENEMEKASAEVTKDNIVNQIDEIRNAKDHLEDPKSGMVFDFRDEVMKFYTRYAKKKGFAVCKRTSSKGNDGEMRYATIICNHSGKQKILSSNITNCKARVTQIYALVESGGEGGGHEKLTFLEKDARDYLNGIRRLQL
ncbi:hypothetical protein ACSBR2_038754 [Camellia fascicularis]